MKRTAALLLAFLVLPGCSTLQAVSAPLAASAPDTINAAKKALTAAHDLHRGTADFLVIAAQTNLCHSVCAATAKDYLDRSEAALVAADSLVALGDAPGIEAKISSATLLIANVQALIGKK